jgi:hypothetical protein
MKSNRIPMSAKICRHGNGSRRIGNASPSLGGDKGLVGESDDNSTGLQALGLVNPHQNRPTLSIGPAAVVNNGDVGIREHGWGDIGGAGDDDNCREAGGENLL